VFCKGVVSNVCALIGQRVDESVCIAFDAPLIGRLVGVVWVFEGSLNGVGKV